MTSYALGWVVNTNDYNITLGTPSLERWFYNEYLGLKTLYDEIDKFFERYDHIHALRGIIVSVEDAIPLPLGTCVLGDKTFVYILSTFSTMDDQQQAIADYVAAFNKFEAKVEEFGYTGPTYKLWGDLVDANIRTPDIFVNYTQDRTDEEKYAEHILSRFDIFTKEPLWYNMQTFNLIF